MLTRCPACATSFRVTPEQLKLRAGKVRCGKCQTVFNAIDSLLESPVPGTAAEPISPPAPQPAASAALVDTIDLAPIEDIGAVPARDRMPDADSLNEPISPEAVRDAALTHGLIAARETTEIPGYNKWAEGALSAPVQVSIPVAPPKWPFVLAAMLLLTTLTGQVAHQFRAELAIAAPALRPLLESSCAFLECDIPLPRHVELVSIEASDLQSDPTSSGALVLAATLKNRAAYAQAWPLLEITLTDVQDNAVLRRVLQPADYLPGKVDPTVFPPNAEIAVKLWLEARDIAAAGYRLYVFYP